jgi:2-methylcitrate dehydratase PrpD
VSVSQSSDSDLTVGEQLARFAVASRNVLPADVIDDGASRVIDVVGNALAARRNIDPTEPHMAILSVLRDRGGKPESSTFIPGERLPASSAALINGTLAHSLDFDDTHLPSVLHPSASVVPAALAVAEAHGASGHELLAAVAVGDEICNRLGMAAYIPALRNSTFFVKGLHATSICGTIGSAVAASMLLGGDEGQILAAMGIAASMGAGIIEANRTGGTVKRIHCGWAAHAGIEAALFAQAGVTGPPTVFEGGFGFLRAYLGDDYDLAPLTDRLGEHWELLRTVYKPYPSNHFTHPIIDCALALRAQGLMADDIDSVEIGAPSTVLRTIAEPWAQKIRPQTPYHAKFSGPFTFAAAMIGGGGLGVHLDDFTDEAIHDPARLALCDRITMHADAICDDEFPNAFSAVVTVRTKAGAVLEHRVHSSRGGPEHPLTTADLALKFRLNAEQVLSTSEADELIDRLAKLQTMERVEAFI